MVASRKAGARVELEASMEEARRKVWMEERSKARVEVWREVEKKAQCPRKAWREAGS